MAPTDCCVARGRGRHEAGDRPTELCKVVGVADQTGVITTILRLSIAIQRVT
jgi:hypothetical protein